MNDIDIPLTKRATSRRFILATIFTVGGTLGLFMGHLTGEHYYWLAGTVLVGFASTEYAKRKPNPTEPTE